MTSKNHNSGNQYHEAYVWIWLSNETEAVVAGKLETDNGNLLFNYEKPALKRRTPSLFRNKLRVRFLKNRKKL